MATENIDFSKYGIRPLTNEPNFASYGIRPYQSASQELISKAQEQAAPRPGMREPQMQEEFSNPTALPSFASRPPEAQRQMLELSAFDPANQTPTGTMVPGGAFEHPATRMAGSMLGSSYAPEFSAGEGMVSRYALNPLMNLLSRLGTGTAGNLAYQAPDIKNLQDLKKSAINDLGYNALIEGGTLPFRAGAHFGEITNPQQLATNKLQQIGDEYKSAKELQRSYYKPVFDKHGETKVSDNALIDLVYPDSVVKRFTPEIKKSYNQLLENPTLNNLHSFNAQVGRDYRRIATTPGKINTAQTLNAVNQDAKGKIVDFLGRDENALNSYNMGSEITKTHVAPFEATPTLEKMAKGVKTDMTPNQVHAAIKKGREKTVGVDKQGRPLLAVHDAHPLTGHMNDISNALDVANFAKQSMPKTLAGLLPGVTGMASTDLGRNIFNYTKPWWYGLGRAYSAEKNRQ